MPIGLAKRSYRDEGSGAKVGGIPRDSGVKVGEIPGGGWNSESKVNCGNWAVGGIPRGK